MRKVSIIIPIYNLNKYIYECYESIKKQTYKNWELLLINDGSTDNSLEVCKDIASKDSRVIVISSHNCGVSHARNLGIENCTGFYTIFIDGDDYIENNTLQSLVENIEENNADISVAKYYYKDKNKISSFGINFKTIKSEELLHKHLRYNFCASMCFGIYKTEIVKNARFSEKIKSYEDWEYLFQIIQLSNIISCCDGCFYHYVTRINSASTSKINKNTLTAFYIPNEVLNKIINFDRYKQEIECLDILILLKITTIYSSRGAESKEIVNFLKSKAKESLRIAKKSKLLSRIKKIYLLIIAIDPSIYRFLFRIKNRRLIS